MCAANYRLLLTLLILRQAPVAQAGQFPAQALEPLVVQPGHDNAFAVRGLGQDQPPGVNDEGAAVGAAARGVLPPLGRRHHVG